MFVHFTQILKFKTFVIGVYYSEHSEFDALAFFTIFDYPIILSIVISYFFVYLVYYSYLKLVLFQWSVFYYKVGKNIFLHPKSERIIGAL